MSYSREFQKALDRTARFDLAPPLEVREVRGRIMSDERIQNLNRVLAPLFSHLVSYEQIVGKCLSEVVNKNWPQF
ncbi:hypothetical protein [Pantoea ananatis]|jgi:hypothetical protein|uniref:hypothetical protein n=1 Tax=Pantoea ananas TaxID=553 RepID=UPI000496E6A2|nr:hypothetical protein [Pantoea ananatis]MDQ1223882.1 hypothetical protein [Pantoea ananatis]MDR6092590.1 hypothetical protein [Pantoea ananatis]NQE77655.1 hypothetical protein [Pantoea ananatis]NQE82199.1 hypothetical protein [Pantoea ananatis]PVY80090.1 hypothetical protein C7427_1211 [Pantoea ananatis]